MIWRILCDIVYDIWRKRYIHKQSKYVSAHTHYKYDNNPSGFWDDVYDD